MASGPIPSAPRQRSPAARFAAIAFASILVAACAAPGATAPSTAPSVAPTVAAPSASGPEASVAPSASAAAAGPTCGTDPVELNAYFETGFDLPFKLSDEFTKQFPNVTWKISQDQFTNLMTLDPAPAVRRHAAGPDPAADDGLAGQGRPAQEPRRLCDRVRLGQVAGRPARAEPRRRRRHPRLRLALRDGPQLQPDRRLLQQDSSPRRSA